MGAGKKMFWFYSVVLPIVHHHSLLISISNNCCDGLIFSLSSHVFQNVFFYISNRLSISFHTQWNPLPLPFITILLNINVRLSVLFSIWFFTCFPFANISPSPYWTNKNILWKLQWPNKTHAPLIHILSFFLSDMTNSKWNCLASSRRFHSERQWPWNDWNGISFTSIYLVVMASHQKCHFCAEIRIF